MADRTWRRVTGWAGALVGLLALVFLIERLDWLIKPVLATLAPFFIAFLIAFLLNPLLKLMERHRIPRVWSVVLISLGFLIVFAGAMFLLVPKLAQQGLELAKSMPEYLQSLEDGLNGVLERHKAMLTRVDLPTTIPELVQRFPSEIRSFSTSALNAVSGFVMASVGKITWLLIVPLLTIWMLMNWDAQRDRLQAIFPEAHRNRMMGIGEAVGAVLNSYVRGALILAVLYGAVTALVLGVFFKMPYSLVLGLVAGLMSPIPYIGSIVILLSTGIVAYATNPSVAYVGGVLAAMMVQNNILFDNIISPKILGGSVGLSLPLSIFALMLGGSLFGIAGMILAVPVGATIKVLIFEFFPQLKRGGSSVDGSGAEKSADRQNTG